VLQHGGDLAVLVGQCAAVHLGGVCRQHNLHPLQQQAMAAHKSGGRGAQHQQGVLHGLEQIKPCRYTQRHALQQRKCQK
jgi:hypothetical protein